MQRSGRCAPWVATLAFAAVVCGSLVARSEVLHYDVAGDESTLFPTAGTTLNLDRISGRATIEDAGNGSPILRDLTLDVEMSQAIPCEGCPGLPVAWRHQLSPAPDQVGVGSTQSAISWGTLSGWSSTGSATCVTPPACQGGCPCVSFVGFEGTGPPPPIAMTSFDSDPWTFSGSGFVAAPIEIVNLQGGFVTETIVWRGTLLAIPALPLLSVGALGTGLLALGVRAVRRRRGVRR